MEHGPGEYNLYSPKLYLVNQRWLVWVYGVTAENESNTIFANKWEFRIFNFKGRQ